MNLAAYIPANLKRSAPYLRLKTSALYDLYWGVLDDSAIRDRDTEIALYQNILTGFRKGHLIFDIGANVGDKVDIFLRMGARVIAVEPDDQNQGIIRGRFLKYRFAVRPVTP